MLGYSSVHHQGISGFMLICSRHANLFEKIIQSFYFLFASSANTRLSQWTFDVRTRTFPKSCALPIPHTTLDPITGTHSLVTVKCQASLERFAQYMTKQTQRVQACQSLGKILTHHIKHLTSDTTLYDHLTVQETVMVATTLADNATFDFNMQSLHKT